jgi:AcrR family transcriptional regulator
MTSPHWEDRVVDQLLKPSEAAKHARFLEASRKIVAVGIELVASSDDGSFTLEEVVARAGISLHSFYRSFPSKDDLSLAIFEEINRVGTAALAKVAAEHENALERLQLIILAPLSDTFEDHPRGIRASFVVKEDLRLRRTHPSEVYAAHAPYRKLLADAIAAAQDAGEFSGINPIEEAELIHLLTGSQYHLLAVGLRADTPPNQVLWEFCIGALRRNSSPSSGKPTSRDRPRTARVAGPR